MNHVLPLTWNPSSTPQEIQDLINTIATEYPITTKGDGHEVRFEKNQTNGNLKVNRQPDGSILVQYDTLQTAARGLAHAFAGHEADENMEFKTFGIMLDCSRDAVMTVTYLKKWLRRLALMGYNMVMLYTEDTYQLPDEPYFGLLRGAYSLQEMQEIDAYAATLGIEMVGCIQTLGHLAQALRWGKIPRDTQHVMLVDDEKTYQLIDKMLDFWRQAFRSNRIHVGMDETHDLGRGQFLDQHGYQRGFDIFTRHLNRVNQQCAAHGLKPIIWSDMFFRMGSKTMNYYDKETVIPEDVKRKIPKEVTLCYWDYYHMDQDFYEDFIDLHRSLGSEPHVASALWSWVGFWYNHAKTARTVTPCIAACRAKKVQDVYFTMWGDDGAYCDYDSVLAGLAWAADLSWGGKGDDNHVAPVYEALCNTPYDEQITASKLQYDFINPDNDQLWSPNVLWDDPLLGIAWREYSALEKDLWKTYLKQLQETRAKLEGAQSHDAAGDIGHICNALDALIPKIIFRDELVKAYDTRDTAKLKELADRQAPQIMEAVRNFAASFRKQWMRRNKPFGMEIIQIRLAGIVARYEETATRIHELLDGTIDSIPELEVKIDQPAGVISHRYTHYASGCMTW